MSSFLSAIKIIDKVGAKKLVPIKIKNFKTLGDGINYFLEHPDELEKQMDILNFNFGLEDKNFISAFYFRQTFRKRIQNPSEETLKNADQHSSWYKMCCALKYLFEDNEEGLELFKIFSSLSEKYDERETEKLWKNCKPTFGGLGHVYKLIPKNQPILNRKELIKLKG